MRPFGRFFQKQKIFQKNRTGALVRNGIFMHETANVARFRKVTPGILASARLAMANDVPSVSKGEVAITLKRAARPLGIDGTTYHVLDILLGLSKARDWDGGNRPVVAISNEKLAEYVGRSERTVIRAIKKLVEAGILAYRDSSTGRRWVHRDAQGNIGRAYGLDFRPAQVRHEEIKALADQYQADLNAEREAKRAVTKLSRAITDVIVVTQDVDLSDFDARMQTILASACEVRERATAMQDLHDALIVALTEMEDTEQGEAAASSAESSSMSCEGDISGSQLYITNSHSLQNHCKQKRTSANAAEPTLSDSFGSASAEIAPEREQTAGTFAPNRRHHPQERQGKADFQSSPHLDGVSINLVQSACYTLQGDFELSLGSWSDLCSAAENIRVGIGVSESAYADAVSRLGRNAAAAILAVVAEKALRDPDQISKPGGYFRAMVERAGEGRLALARSLFGLAAG